MSWFFCSLCGATRRCDVCRATECGQDMDAACLGCREVRAQPMPRFMRDADSHHRRPSKAARKIRSRVERAKRLWRRHNPPTPWETILGADWG